MKPPQPMAPLLELTPLEASDVLFELVMTDPASRARALAIARERTRDRRRSSADEHAKSTA